MLEEDNWLAMRTVQAEVDNPVDGEDVSIRGDHLVILAKKPSIIDHLSLEQEYILGCLPASYPTQVILFYNQRMCTTVHTSFQPIATVQGK